MQRMSESLRSPYPDWQTYAPALRRHAEDLTTTARLPPGITLAQWFAENELLLQQEPTQARTRVVATALLPLVEEQPDCWRACEHLDDDKHRSFQEYLQDWHARVPEKHRWFVRRVAEEFGIEIKEESHALSKKNAGGTTAK
jgi:hypothetical protein